MEERRISATAADNEFRALAPATLALVQTESKTVLIEQYLAAKSGVVMDLDGFVSEISVRENIRR